MGVETEGVEPALKLLFYGCQVVVIFSYWKWSADGAVLHCIDPGRLKPRPSLGQIAISSSLNATANRRLVGSSTASSCQPRRRFWTNECQVTITPLLAEAAWPTTCAAAGRPQRSSAGATSMTESVFATAAMCR